MEGHLGTSPAPTAQWLSILWWSSRYEDSGPSNHRMQASEPHRSWIYDPNFYKSVCVFFFYLGRKLCKAFVILSWLRRKYGCHSKIDSQWSPTKLSESIATCVVLVILSVWGYPGSVKVCGRWYHRRWVFFPGRERLLCKPVKDNLADGREEEVPQDWSVEFRNGSERVTPQLLDLYGDCNMVAFRCVAEWVLTSSLRLNICG